MHKHSNHIVLSNKWPRTLRCQSDPTFTRPILHCCRGQNSIKKRLLINPRLVPYLLFLLPCRGYCAVQVSSRVPAQWKQHSHLPVWDAPRVWRTSTVLWRWGEASGATVDGAGAKFEVSKGVIGPESHPFVFSLLTPLSIWVTGSEIIFFKNSLVWDSLWQTESHVKFNLWLPRAEMESGQARCFFLKIKCK